MCTWTISNFLIPALVSTPVSRIIYIQWLIWNLPSHVRYVSQIGSAYNESLDYCWHFKNKKTSFSPVVPHFSECHHHSHSCSCPNAWLLLFPIIYSYPVPQWILPALSSEIFFLNPESTQYENHVTTVLVHTVIISFLNHFKNLPVGVPNGSLFPHSPQSILYTAPRYFLVDGRSCHSPPSDFHEFLITLMVAWGKGLVWAIPRLPLWFHVLPLLSLFTAI